MISRITRFASCWRVLSFDAAKLAALQAGKLQETVKHAYDNVPYYRHLFDREALKPSDIRTPDDLAHVPISRKEDLLNAEADDLISRKVDRSSLYASSTSGSTGKPFTVLRTLRDVQTRKLYDLRALTAVGFRPFEKLAAYTVRRAYSGPNSQKLLYRNKWVSALEPMDTAAAELSAYDPDWMWCYPSTFRSLLDYTNGRLDSVCKPRALVTGAECPDESVRDACKALALQHFNFYGAVETGRIAWECRSHMGLHLNTDNVVLEIIPSTDRDRVDNAEFGETVVTTLNNEAMPLIRYQLGDLSRYLEEQCSCGITLPLIAPPVGRTADVVKLGSGRLLSARGLASLTRRHQGVRQLRITQASLRHIEVELVVDDTFSNEAVGMMRAQLQEYLSEPIDVVVRLVETIKQTGPKAKDFVSLIGQQ